MSIHSHKIILIVSSNFTRKTCYINFYYKIFSVQISRKQICLNKQNLRINAEIVSEMFGFAKLYFN